MPPFSIATFLGVRLLTQPTGRPLYTYRCTEDEFAALEHRLREGLPDAVERRRVGPQTTQEFCLWAAEWWRLHHAGGSWRWEDLLARLRVEELGPYRGAYGLLCDIVTSGLHAWRRPLLRTAHGRAFLVTLACEGGLPLKVLTREQAGLRRYFRALLEEFRIYAAAGVPEHELAARVADHLPRSLRHEVVYELSGRLIARVGELQKEVGGSRSPVAYLDAARPGWRDELPLRVSDETAATLLNGLLIDAGVIARGGATQVRWARWIEQTGCGWTLAGELRLPSSLEPEDLTALFALTDGSDPPARFELGRRSDGGAFAVLALGTQRQVGGRTRLILEQVPGRSPESRVEGAARGQALVLRTANRSVESRSFSGAAPLSDLPWVWIPVVGTGRYELAGQGSMSIAADHALVATTEGTRIEVDPAAGSCEPAGRISELGRELYRIRGTVCLRDYEGSYAIRTGAERSASGVEYVLQGRRREVGREGTPVFIGLPQLLERRDDGSAPRKVPAVDLSWRADGLPGSTWIPLTDRCVGDGRVRCLEGGAVRHVVRTKILPAGAKIRFRPERSSPAGDIDFLGFAPAAVRLLSPAGVTSTSSRPEVGLDRLSLRALGPLPENVEIELEWKGRGRLRLSLPFPAFGAGFQTPNGETLPHNATLPLGSLSGVRAYALVPLDGAEFFVVGTFLGDDQDAMAGVPRTFRVPMEAVDAGRFELDLGRLEQEVHRRVARSGDPESVVRLSIASNDVPNLPQPLVRVAAFDLNFEAEGEPGIIYVTTESYPGLAESEAATLHVEAVPLGDLEREPLVLEHERDRRWRARLDEMEAGPWLVFGRQGDWYRVRPFFYRVRPEEAARVPGRFACAVLAGHGHGRALMDAVAHALAADAGHLDWPVVYALVRRARKLPASAFDLLRALARCPEAAALAALRAAPDDLPLLWSAMESLPFAWRHVSRSAWSHAVARLLERTRTEVGALPSSLAPDPDALVLEHLNGAVRRVSGELGPLQPLLTLTLCTLLGRKIPQQTAGLHTPQFRQVLLTEYRAFTGVPPALPPGAISEVDHLASLVGQLAAVPGGAELLTSVWGGRGNEQAQTIRSAPAVTALAALANVPLSPAQQMQLRAVADLAPDWFAHVYDYAALFALGAPFAAVASHGMGGGPKPVLQIVN